MGGICYHVLSRGNARGDVFHKDADFAAFIKLIAAANERLPMRVLAYCLLNNHFHLVLWPHNDGDLSRWMQWLLTSHLRRYHRHYQSSGHVWKMKNGSELFCSGFRMRNECIGLRPELGLCLCLQRRS